VLKVAYTKDDLLKKAKAKLTDVNPIVVDKALQLVSLAFDKGFKLLITQGFRSYAYQNELYAQSRTQAQLNAVGLKNVVAKPNEPWATNARGGYSYHNFGLAFDFAVLDKDDKIDWDTVSKYNTVGALGKTLGLEWGGDWTKSKDRPHFQMTFGLSEAQLRAGKKPPTQVVETSPNKPSTSKPSDSKATPPYPGVVYMLKDTLMHDKNIERIQRAVGIPEREVDGYYGADTAKKVREYQKRKGLSVDGRVGRDTWNTMF